MLYIYIYIYTSFQICIGHNINVSINKGMFTLHNSFNLSFQLFHPDEGTLIMNFGTRLPNKKKSEGQKKGELVGIEFLSLINVMTLDLWWQALATFFKILGV